MDPDKPRLVDLASGHVSGSSTVDSGSKPTGLPPASTSYPYPVAPGNQQLPIQYPEPSAPPPPDALYGGPTFTTDVAADGAGYQQPTSQPTAAEPPPPQEQKELHQLPSQPPTPATQSEGSILSNGHHGYTAHGRPESFPVRCPIKVEEKSLLEAYILCIPLGFLGLHHFYLGRVGIGFLYFFTFGLFGIGWIVDWFRLPWLVKETNRNKREEAERGYIVRGGPFNDLDRRSFCTAYLFWLPPVGILGGHHYYLGRVGWGITYTMTLGLFGVGWLLDLCRIPTLAHRTNEEINALRSGQTLSMKPGSRMHLDDAYYLAFPLGFLGLHHFYMHRWMFGITYFLTFGCLGVGFLVDLFRMPCLFRRTKRELENEDVRFHLDDAYLMWFPLGVLGLHHFYLRRWGWGLVYFFTLGLFGLGWLSDICRLPSLVKNANERRESALLSNQHQPTPTYTYGGIAQPTTNQAASQQIQTPSQGNLAVYAFPLDAHGHPIWTEGVAWPEQRSRDPTMPSVGSHPWEPPPPYSQTDSTHQAAVGDGNAAVGGKDYAV